MVEMRQEAFARLEKKALKRFTSPVPSPPFSDSCDISLTLITQPHYDDWDAWHVGLDPVRQTAFASHILWARVFDVQRFRDPFMGLKYGWKETPTMEFSSHKPPFAISHQYFSEIVGAVPADAFPDDGIFPDGILRSLTLRLPLGTLSFVWGLQRDQWEILAGHFDAFHNWLATTPLLEEL